MLRHIEIPSENDGLFEIESGRELRDAARAAGRVLGYPAL
jgi:hypothetical protein